MSTQGEAGRIQKRDPVRDYWLECVDIAAEDCGVTLTNEQAECFAGAFESSHDNYGMAFYSPPSSDRIADLQRDFDKRLAYQQGEADKAAAAARRLDEDRVRTIRRQAWKIDDLLEGRNEK